jgi:hypothetical protein
MMTQGTAPKPYWKHCGLCVFYSEGFADGDPKICRRHPPAGAGKSAGFPSVSFLDWCGEYQGRGSGWSELLDSRDLEYLDEIAQRKAAR